MKHRVIKPGWYGKGLAGGEFAWLIEDQHILTRDTTVPLPGENVLFLDAHLWQGIFYFGGKGGRTDTAWLWNGTEWKNLGVAAANYPLAFEANKVYISTGGAVDVYDITTLTLIESRPIAVGVNGIRQVIGGVIISGDNTYHSPEMGINEYTQMVELYTGIQTATDAAIVWDGQRRVLLDEVDGRPIRARFVEGDRKGNDLCVSFQDQAANVGHLFWFTRGEVSTLPPDEPFEDLVNEPVVTVDKWTLDDVLNGKEFVFHDSANPDLGYAMRVWVEGGAMYASVANAVGKGQTQLKRAVKPCSQTPVDPIDPPDPEPEPDLGMRAVAFGPNLGSGDFRILFTEDNLWTGWKNLAGFHFYGQNVLPIMQELVGPNTYEGLRDSNAFKKCKEWGLTTEMELAGPPEQAYEAEAKIAAADGRLDMLSYDDTFSGISVTDFARWVKEYRVTRPRWIILVYAAFPMVSADQIIARVRAWFALGARPDVIRMDVDPGARSRFTRADFDKIRAFCTAEQIGLQYVVNARDGLTEAAYCQEAWNWHQTAEAMGKWDGRIVQSWATARGSSDRTLPRNLREGEVGAFTTLLKNVLLAHPALVPPAPPVVKLTTDRLIFRRDGQAWRWKGVTAFKLARLHADGHDITPFLTAYKGFNVLRVFDYAVVNAPGFTWDSPSIAQTRAFLDYVGARGFYVELVLLTDDNPARLDHARALVAALGQSHPATLIEIGNEPNTNKHIDTSALRAAVDASGLLYSSGDYDDSPKQFGPFLTYHSARDSEWSRKAHDAVEYYYGGGPSRPTDPGHHSPCVADEPIRPDQVNPAWWDMEQDYVAYFATAALLGTGGTFHSETGKFGQLPSDLERRMAAAALRGLDHFPPDAPLAGPYERIDEHGATLRTYKIGPHIVRIRPVDGVLFP